MINSLYQKDNPLKRFNNQLANELFKNVSRKISLQDKMDLLRVDRILNDNVKLNISCEVYRKIKHEVYRRIRINNESTR